MKYYARIGDIWKLKLGLGPQEFEIVGERGPPQQNFESWELKRLSDGVVNPYPKEFLVDENGNVGDGWTLVGDHEIQEDSQETIEI